LIALGWATWSWAAPARLNLPLYNPAAGATRVPAYAAQKFEIKLAGGAVDRTRLTLTARTGRPSVDALLGQFGVPRLEPEFPGTRDPNLSSYYIVHLPAGGVLPPPPRALPAPPPPQSAHPLPIPPLAA